MSLAGLVLAALSAAVFLGSGAVVARTVQRRWFPGWPASAAVVVVALVGICWALLLGQALGGVGGLRAGPLLAAAVASAAAVALAGRRAGPAADPGTPGPAGADGDPDAPPRAQAALVVATVLLVLLVAALWTARTALAVRGGIGDPDSLGYHLPFAATFAQTGFADQNRFVLPGLPVQFYPGNDELLAAIGLVLTRSLAFAAVKNLLLGALVLTAAHALGSAFRAGVVAVAGTAVVLGLPVVAFSQPGEAVNDVLVVFLLLGALAVLAHARDRPAPYVLALVCCGAAAGTKLSAIAPAAAVAAFALWLLVTRLPAGRLRAAALGAVGAAGVGVSWYVRNAATYGSPLPPARIGIGPLQLPQIKTEVLQYSYSVAWYLVRGRALGQLWDGLGEAMGPLFLPVLGAVAFGVVAGLRSPDRFRRGLAVVTVLAGIGYLTTPASAYGAEGVPEGFVINVHYAAAALAIGMVTASIALAGRRAAVAVPVVGWLAVAGGIPAGQRIAFWAPGIGGGAFALLVAASLLGGLVVWLARRRELLPWARAAAGMAVAVAAVGVAVIVRHHPPADADPIRRWAADARPTRIAGWVPEVALLYGPGVANRAVTLTRLADGAPVPLDSCPDWMEALRQGGFPFTGVIPGTMWQRWLAADPAFQLVAQREGHAAIYRVAGPPDPACPGAG